MAKVTKKKQKKVDNTIKGQSPLNLLNIPGVAVPISDIDIVKPFRGISNIKSAGDTIKVSKEEREFLIKEVQKCKQDIIYFAENYFYIVSYKGKHVIKLFDKQKLMLKSFIENNFTVCLAARQSGKCVHQYNEITIRNKISGEISTIKIGDFFEKIKKTNT